MYTVGNISNLLNTDCNTFDRSSVHAFYNTASSIFPLVDSGGIHGVPDLENGVPIQRCDSGISDDRASADASAPPGATTGGGGPDAISEALSTLSSEVRPPPADAKGKNVKDILRSLVSSPHEDVIVDSGLLPPAFLGGLGDASRDPSRAYRSFDRSVGGFYPYVTYFISMYRCVALEIQ